MPAPVRKPTPLKLAIVASGRRQKDVATAVGIDEVVFSRIVNGLHTSDARKAAIAAELATNVDALWPSSSSDDLPDAA